VTAIALVLSSDFIVHVHLSAPAPEDADIFDGITVNGVPLGGADLAFTNGDTNADLNGPPGSFHVGDTISFAGGDLLYPWFCAFSLVVG